MSQPVSRRDFVNMVGRAGGAAAIYSTMAAMGLLRTPPAYAGPPQLARTAGGGRKVLIIGAGIAGMAAAYELRKAGFQCRILEARGRSGGRVWTLRGGDTIEESASRQFVAWDKSPHLYFNLGAARLPSHHKAVLGYCRQFGVALEVMINDNRSALFQDDAAFAGQPLTSRAVHSDLRGFIAELAAKSIEARALDAAFSSEDRERLRELVRVFGDLDRTLLYKGSARGGYSETPGVGPGKIRDPMDFRQLLRSDIWKENLHFGEEYEQAATMMQPVGGMDAIPRAFARHIGPIVTYNAEVRQLRRSGEVARVVWRDRLKGSEHAELADFVICTVPAPVLKGIAADFSPAVQAAIAAHDYISAVKVAFEAQRRFWELDHNIYGGITWTSRPNTQIWYPPTNIHGRKGVLIGAYIWSNEIGDRFAAMSPAERNRATLGELRHVHADIDRHLAKGTSGAWSKVPFSLGAWWEWSSEARRNHYAALSSADGPFYFAGEHVSYINGWQEGAILSAHHAVKAIAARAAAKQL